MPQYDQQFSFPQLVDPQPLLEQLKTLGAVSSTPQEGLHGVLLDTFDWRLHQAGLQLLAHGDGSDWVLELLEATNTRIVSQSVPALPRFPTELPLGELRQQVLSPCDCRALLVRIETHFSRYAMELHNDDGKTIAQLHVESHRDPQHHPLPVGLRVRPLRGYQEETEAQLAPLLALHPRSGPTLPVDAALEAAAISPGDYSNKLRYRLDPTLPAGPTVALILADLFHTLQRNETGTREALDSEFLHDYRVAIRRTRAALGQLKGVFPTEITRHFQQEFAWLGQATGPTRDLDVYLLHFAELQAPLPTPMQATLLPLREILQQRWQEAQQVLLTQLDSPRYTRLLNDWSGFLDGAHTPTTPEGARPILAVARQRIWKSYRRVLKEGRALHDGSPEEDFHELRKHCKKLRYLLEFFQSLFPAETLRPLIKNLKGLQENLGDHQDQSVQAAFLQQLAVELPDHPERRALLLAMGALVADLLRRQQASRGEFAGRFAAFQAPEQQARFRELFHPTQEVDSP